MIPPALKSKLAALAIAFGAAGALGGGWLLTADGRYVPAEVVAAMEVGSYYESSGRHIGTPYRDTLGKGQPWTVCAGVTGAGVVPGQYYTEADCRALETPRYMDAYRDTRQLFSRWDSYDVWTRASWIDAVWNLGAAAVAGSTMRKLANAGDLTAACEEQRKWVLGTVAGQKQRLPGLVNRRGATRDLCAHDFDFAEGE